MNSNGIITFVFDLKDRRINCFRFPEKETKPIMEPDPKKYFDKNAEACLSMKLFDLVESFHKLPEGVQEKDKELYISRTEIRVNLLFTIFEQMSLLPPVHGITKKSLVEYFKTSNENSMLNQNEKNEIERTIKNSINKLQKKSQK